jgi:hypothetical protein
MRESLRGINSSVTRERKTGETIPEHQVTRIKVHFLQRAPTVLEPLNIIFLEDKKILEVLFLRRLILAVVLLSLPAKELVMQFAATLHQNQTPVIGAIGLVIQQTLHTLHALAVR